MKEISLHILDIAQNSIQANASNICIEISEFTEENKFIVRITDNGDGMNQKQVKQVLDPFYTTKNKKTGLGIPLLKQHAQITGGDLKIDSQNGQGTVLSAEFALNHIDRQPMGNISKTLTSLIQANQEIQIIYKHNVNEKIFILDTLKIKEELNGLEITNNEVLNFLNEMIVENLNEIGASL